MPRKPHQKTPQLAGMIENMAAFGITVKQICAIVGVHERTLLKYYKHELETGPPKAIANVANSLYRIATGDGPQAARAAEFYLRTRARWSTVHEVHLHGVPAAEDKYISSMVNLQKLTNEELVLLEGITKRLERQPERTIEVAAGPQDATNRIASLN